MSNFLGTHRSKILDRTAITYRDIQVGDVLEFRYRGKKSNSTKLKIVIVINIYPVRGSWKNKKVHAFDLEKLAPGVLKRILNRIGTPMLELDERKNKEVVKVNIKESGLKGEIFYRKVASKFNDYDAYRTYIATEMKSIKLVEYDFQHKQLGLKDENLLQDTDT